MNQRREHRARLRRGEPTDVERCTQWVRVEVRYSDLDAQRHVNNGVYFTYFEQARVAFIGQARMHALAREVQSAEQGPGDLAQTRSSAWIEASDISYVIANASCEYQKPITSLAPIAIGVYCGDVSRASFQIHYVVCDEGRQTVYATGTTLLVNVDQATGRPRMLPDWLRGALAE